MSLQVIAVKAASLSYCNHPPTHTHTRACTCTCIHAHTHTHTHFCLLENLREMKGTYTDKESTFFSCAWKEGTGAAQRTPLLPLPPYLGPSLCLSLPNTCTHTHVHALPKDSCGALPPALRSPARLPQDSKPCERFPAVSLGRPRPCSFRSTIIDEPFFTNASTHVS